MDPANAYVLFSAVIAASQFLHAATYVPFLTQIGLSLSDIAYINAVFWFVIVVLELPTGIFADKISRSASLGIGAVCYTMGLGLYGVAHTRGQAMLSEIVLGAGAAFLSGVQQAWITDTLLARGEMKRLKSTFATASAVEGVLAIPASIIGSWWAVSYGTRSIWYICMVFGAIACLIVWRHMRMSGDPVTKLNELDALRQSVRALRASQSLRWITGVSCIMALVTPFNHYWAPFFQNRGVGIGSLAYVWGPVYGSVAIGSLIVRRGYLRGSEERWLVLSAIAAGGGLIIMGWLPGLFLPIAAAAIHDAGRGAFRPLVDTYTQHRVESAYRATYGSLQSFIARSGNGLVLAIVTWFMMGRIGINGVVSVWTGCGLALIVSAYLLYVLRPKSRI